MVKKNNSWFDKKQIIPIVISAIITFISIYYAFYLNSPYLEKIEPTIEVYSPAHWFENLSSISAKRMTTEPDYAASLKLCLRNTGKEETGMVEFTIDSPFNGSHLYLENIQGHDEKCETLQFWVNDCFLKGICNMSALPKGKTNLDIFVNCPKCAPNKFNKNVSVCIWHDKAEECWN